MMRHSHAVALWAGLAMLGCGDVIVNSIDGGSPQSDSGSSDAQRDADAVDSHRVFISAQIFPGALGGLTGADALCSEYAAKAGLPGRWMALLTDSKSSLKDRIQILGPVYTMAGTLVVADAAEFATGDARNRNTLTELNTLALDATVWVGDLAKNCKDWTSADPGLQGETADATDLAGWLTSDGDDSCDDLYSLQCISQL
ncbi:MAG: hypothetical protein MJE77_00240 [Proteobacteria bacterium]|nr:hypothetical protein [Pseudomonadota bacterium]